MGGERQKASLTENQPFVKNLCALMAERKETQKDLATELGVKQQTISYYRQGQSLPDAEKLVKIAQHYGVTTDYLLGLSDVRTPNSDIVGVCKLTKLSESSVMVLIRDHSASKVINALLEQQHSSCPDYFDVPDSVRFSADFKPNYDDLIPVAIEAMGKYLGSSYNKKAQYTVAELEPKGGNITSVWPYQDVGYEVLERVMLDNIANGIKAIKDRVGKELNAKE